jgi:hypothetical protein
MGVNRRQNRLRGFRRLVAANVPDFSNSYKISLNGLLTAWTPDAQAAGLQ